MRDSLHALLQLCLSLYFTTDKLGWIFYTTGFLLNGILGCRVKQNGFVSLGDICLLSFVASLLFIVVRTFPPWKLSSLRNYALVVQLDLCSRPSHHSDIVLPAQIKFVLVLFRPIITAAYRAKPVILVCRNRYSVAWLHYNWRGTIVPHI